MADRRKGDIVKKWLLAIGKHLIQEDQKRRNKKPKRRKGDKK